MAPTSTSSVRRQRLVSTDINVAGYATRTKLSPKVPKGRPALGRPIRPGQQAQAKGRKSSQAVAAVRESWEYTSEKILQSPDFPDPAAFSPEQRVDMLQDTPKDAIINGLQKVAQIQEKISIIRTNQGIEAGQEAWVKVKWRNASSPTIEVVGQAPSRQLAAKAAWQHVALVLNHQGRLGEVLREDSTKVDESIFKTEQTALVDVYDYCARYDELPSIERSVMRRAKSVQFITRISFPLQQISVRALAPTIQRSETIASVKFKQAVEEFHAQQGTESLVVKAYGSFNTANVGEFIDFYKTQKRLGGRIGVEMYSTQKDQLHHATATHNGSSIGPEVIMQRKKGLEKIAFLAAALELTKKEPSLKTSFLEALKAGNGKLLVPLPPMDLPIEYTAVLLMRDTLAKARNQGLSDRYHALEAEAAESTDLSFSYPLPGQDKMDLRNAHLKEHRQRYAARHDEMRKIRDSLPMNQYTQDVIDLVEKNVYSIIIGETGSGKTTQVPQVLLDHYAEQGKGAECNIVCTQPRRIAATSVAKRVATERGESVRDVVGYHVRGENFRVYAPGSINFCTTGILLAQLQSDPDRVLERVSHIVIDEVHERDKFIDFLMVILKQVMASRLSRGLSVPRVILMSATLDPKLFAPYFKNKNADGTLSDCPALRVPGRTFPVAEQYLEEIYGKIVGQNPGFAKYTKDDKFTGEYLESEREFAQQNPISDGSTNALFNDATATRKIIDWKRQSLVREDAEEHNDRLTKLVPSRLIAAAIAHIVKTTEEGAILCFLPGWEEIQAVFTELETRRPLGVDFKDPAYRIFLLHSNTGQQQQEVFEKMPPGQRKIILSTNIAETSVTIPDVQHVVDTGKSREVQYDQKRKLKALTCSWVSKSNIKQRAGRAGRVQNGNYYALYTRARFESLRAEGLPELLRTDLSETCLGIVAQNWSTPPREFLAAALEPPNPSAVDTAVESLVAIQAVTPDEQLTPLGRLLAALPIHPELGKMIVLGIIFRCLDPIIILGSATASRPLFVIPQADQRKDRAAMRAAFAANTQSDHMATLNAFKEVRKLHRTHGMRLARDFALSKGIHYGGYSAIEATAHSLESALMEAKIIQPIHPYERAEHQYGDQSLNVNSGKYHIIQAILAGGLYPKLAVKSDSSRFFWRTMREAEVKTHAGSISFVPERRRETSRQTREAEFAVYDQLMQSNDGTLSMRTMTSVTPLSVALFCGRLSGRNQPSPSTGKTPGSRLDSSRVLEVDSWIPFFVQSDDSLAGRTLIELRKALERMLVNAYADLSKRETLAEDPVRNIFASGIVDILGMDISGKQETTGPKNSRSYEDMWNSVKDRMGESGSQPAALKWKFKPTGVEPDVSMMEWAAKWESNARAKKALKEKNEGEGERRWAGIGSRF